MNMRFILTLTAGLLAAANGLGQVPGADDEQPATPVTRLAIAPTPAPIPALRYQLLPELRDTTPGNAALLYYRAFSPEWISNFLRPESRQALEEAETKPLRDLKSKVGADVGIFGWVRQAGALREVDRAARRQYCDWDMVGRVREEGISMLLPDVQSLRNFARMLAVRARLELADGNFDKAVYTLQTGLQLGRHAADAPTLIQALVGTGIANSALTQVEEFIRTPGAPNLYWALTALPQPFIDLRKPYQGERLMIDNLLPGFREALRDPHATPMSPQQVEELGVKLAHLAESVKTEAKPWLLALALKKYSPAKEYLRRHGRSEQQVNELPVLQAVLLYEVAEYDRFFDEQVKWQGQPYEIQRRGLAEADEALRREVARVGAPGLSLAGMLLPAVFRVSEASARLDRRIAALRCVEAVRLHAATHGGQLPASLAAIAEVPVPGDPITSRAFEYTVAGGTATLTAPPPDRSAPSPQNSFKYEIRIAQ
jgi:hypothetical protein